MVRSPNASRRIISRSSGARLKKGDWVWGKGGHFALEGFGDDGRDGRGGSGYGVR
jgi:hypothetical protein